MQIIFEIRAEISYNALRTATLVCKVFILEPIIIEAYYKYVVLGDIND
jgi:hypothetical protein